MLVCRNHRDRTGLVYMRTEGDILLVGHRSGRGRRDEDQVFRWTVHKVRQVRCRNRCLRSSSQAREGHGHSRLPYPVDRLQRSLRLKPRVSNGDPCEANVAL